MLGLGNKFEYHNILDPIQYLGIIYVYKTL